MNAAATWVFQDPLQNPENCTFWQEAQQGRLMLKHCSDWDAVHIGMRVQMSFSASASGQNVPVFVPHEQFKASV